jgi:hypothetical protein
MSKKPAEKWLPVAGYEHLYEVSNLGRVRRSLKHISSKPGPLKASVHLGIQTVTLCMNGKKKDFGIHRLVAEAFIGPVAGKIVAHKSGDKTDNRVENLEFRATRPAPSATAERWRPVRGYESLYAVSDLGNVRRSDFYNNSKDAPLRPSVVAHYHRVTLSKNGKRRNFLVHRLVCEAFLGIPEGLCVNHKNGNRLDNTLANLEAVTHKENERHKREVLKPARVGS